MWFRSPAEIPVSVRVLVPWSRRSSRLAGKPDIFHDPVTLASKGFKPCCRYAGPSRVDAIARQVIIECGSANWQSDFTPGNRASAAHGRRGGVLREAGTPEPEAGRVPRWPSAPALSAAAAAWKCNRRNFRTYRARRVAHRRQPARQAGKRKAADPRRHLRGRPTPAGRVHRQAGRAERLDSQGEYERFGLRGRQAASSTAGGLKRPQAAG